MLNYDLFIILLELIGSAAFAVSGVMVAKDRKMDLFGAIVLGCVTAVGGGVIRDLLLGNTPPLMFRDPIYVLCAFIVSLITFHLEYKQDSHLEHYKNASARILNITDSLGLAVFVITGSRTAIEAGFASNEFLCIFVGTVTGIGGGILRDMMAGQMPLIMSKRIYGLAAVIGASIFVFLNPLMPDIYAMAVSFTSTLLIRYFAIRYGWHLPKFN